MATATAEARERERLDAVRRYAILDTPPDGAFDRVCVLAARFFHVPFASVTIVDEDRIWFKASMGLDAVEIPRVPGLCASAILHDEPYVVTSALSDPRTADNQLVHGDLGVRFYAAAPIVTADGHSLGTVNVIHTEPRAISDDEIQTLQDLAGVVMDQLELRLAAIREVQQAINQQRRAESLARTLQQSLSPPHLPQIGGLDVAVHYEPFAAEEVGGDFYDLFPLTTDRTGFFLGDVCGKGPEAAVVTSLARYTIRTAAMLSEGPEAILANLNSALLMEHDGAGLLRMCTVVYGEIDTSREPANVTLAVAGHPAPLVVRADGAIESPVAHGTILGAFPNPDFETCAFHLHAGDAIVVYSDGILDTAIEGAPVDEARVQALLAETTPGASAGDLVGRLERALRSASLRDDVAIMALRTPAA